MAESYQADAAGCQVRRRCAEQRAEMVWLQTNYMSHKAFYKIIDIVRSKNIPLQYFTSASAAKGAEQVAAADSGK